MKVSPSVIMSILNSHTRRPTKESHIIGALLGEVRDGIVYVTECFAVTFKEYNEANDELCVVINKEYFLNMLSMHLHNNKKEVFVGWYTTPQSNAEAINDTSALYNEFFKEFHPNPVSLVVDTTLKNDMLNIKGYINKETKLNGEVLSSTFYELKVDIEFNDSESTIFYHMIYNNKNPNNNSRVFLSTIDSVTNLTTKSIENFMEIIENINNYIDAVLSGRIEANSAIGMELMDIINTFKANKLTEAQIRLIQTRYNDLVSASQLASVALNQSFSLEKVLNIV